MNELERLQGIIKEKRQKISAYKDLEWYAAMDAAYERVEEEIEKRLAEHYHLSYFGY